MVKDLHAENYKALIKINADDSNRKISYAQDERIDTVKMAILLRASYRFNLQFSSVIQSCPTLCNPMDCSTPGFPVHHQLHELTQTDVHRVGDATDLM